MSLEKLGEFGLIEHLAARLGVRAGVRLGIGDDIAVLDALAAPVVSCDALIEGVHFRRDWTTARSLGRKAIAVNVSDLAASGARPVAAFVSLALSPADDLAFIEELYDGLEAESVRYGCTVAGGDTVRTTGPTMLSLTVVGEPLPGGPILRSNAQPGDAIVVTGTLGDSAGGLALLRAPVPSLNPLYAATLRARHNEPTARLVEMRAALEVPSSAGPAVHAALDLSDGLAGDASHIAERSRLSLEMDVQEIPISESATAAAAAMGTDARDWALYGGEDYELLLCVDWNSANRVCGAIADATGTRATVIGRCVESPSAQPNSRECAVVLLDQYGKRTAARGAFTHF